MTLFTEGRMQAYERMMQQKPDYSRTRSDAAKKRDQRMAVYQTNGLSKLAGQRKGGGSYGCHQG